MSEDQKELGHQWAADQREIHVQNVLKKYADAKKARLQDIQDKWKEQLKKLTIKKRRQYMRSVHLLTQDEVDMYLKDDEYYQRQIQEGLLDSQLTNQLKLINQLDNDHGNDKVIPDSS